MKAPEKPERGQPCNGCGLSADGGIKPVDKILEPFQAFGVVNKLFMLRYVKGEIRGGYNIQGGKCRSLRGRDFFHFVYYFKLPPRELIDILFRKDGFCRQSSPQVNAFFTQFGKPDKYRHEIAPGDISGSDHARRALVLLVRNPNGDKDGPNGAKSLYPGGQARMALNPGKYPAFTPINLERQEKHADKAKQDPVDPPPVTPVIIAIVTHDRQSKTFFPFKSMSALGG